MQAVLSYVFCFKMGVFIDMVFNSNESIQYLKQMNPLYEKILLHNFVGSSSVKRFSLVLFCLILVIDGCSLNSCKTWKCHLKDSANELAYSLINIIVQKHFRLHRYFSPSISHITPILSPLSLHSIKFLLSFQQAHFLNQNSSFNPSQKSFSSVVILYRCWSRHTRLSPDYLLIYNVTLRNTLNRTLPFLYQLISWCTPCPSCKIR